MTVEFYSKEYQTIAQDIKNMQAEINNTDNPNNYRIKLAEELSGKKAELEACSLKINELSQENAEKMLQDANCEDGKNDGKIGFWRSVGHCFKGVGNFFKNMVCDEKGFSLGKTLKNLAIGAGVGALCFFTAGTAIPFVVAGAGAVMAGTQAVKMGIKMHNAQTDNEMIAACEGFGEATTGFALSLAGARGAYKANVAKNGSFMLKGKDPIFAMNKGTIDFAKSGINSADDLKAQNAFKNAKPQEQEAMMNQFNAWKAKQPQTAQAAVPQTQSSAAIKSLWDAKTAELAKAPFWKKNKLRKECKKLFALYTRAKGRELNYRVLAEESSAARWKFGQFKGSTARKLTSKGTPYRKNIVKLEKLEKAAAEAKELKDTYIKMVRDGVLPEDKTIPESLLRSPSKAPAVATTTQAPSEVPVNASSIVFERTEFGKAVDSAKAFANGTAKLASDSAQMVYNGSKSAVIGTGKLAYNTANYKYLKGPIWVESIEQPFKNFTYDKLNMEEDELKSFAKILKERAKRSKLTDKQIQELAKKFLEDNKNKDKKTA